MWCRLEGMKHISSQRRMYYSLGFILIVIILFFVFHKNSSSPVSIEDTKKKTFVIEEWLASDPNKNPSTRILMVDDLLKSETVIGLDGGSVKQVLGKPTTENGTSTFIYFLGKDNSKQNPVTENLVITFRKGFVGDAKVVRE